MDETELSHFFSPSKKNRHRMKKEKAVMATKKCIEFRLILQLDWALKIILPFGSFYIILPFGCIIIILHINMILPFRYINIFFVNYNILGVWGCVNLPSKGCKKDWNWSTTVRGSIHQVWSNRKACIWITTFLLLLVKNVVQKNRRRVTNTISFY